MSIATRRMARRALPKISLVTGMGLAIPYWDLISGTDAEQHHRFDMISATGCEWLRTDAYWYHLEEVKGGTNFWTEFDGMLAKARTRNLRVVLVIHTTPEWSRPVGSPVTYGPSTSVEQDNYAAFCADLVRRYGTSIAAYEIWNEQNLDQFWSPTPSVASYTSLLKKSYTAMKAVNYNVAVISGGTGGAVPDGKDIDTETFITGVYDAGGKNYCDGIAVHPYTNKDGLMSGELWLASARIRGLMDARGDRTKQLWGTETGVPTKGVDGVTMTEAAQAQLVSDTATYWRAIPYAGPLMWYTLEDRSHTATDVESYFGILRYDGQKKLAYQSLMKVNNISGANLPAPTSYPTRVVSVRDYGAMVDGVTDDTEAVNSAINAVAATGGIVTIPDGTVRVILSWRGWITVPSNVTLRGLGARSTITVESPNSNYHELLRLTGTNICIEHLKLTRIGTLYGVMVGVNTATNVWLHRVVIDGQKTTSGGADFHGVMLSGGSGSVSDGLHMVGMTLKRCDFGLLHASNDLATFRNISVEACLFEDIWASELEFNAPNSVMEYVSVKHSTFRNNQSAGPSAGWAVGLANVQHVSIIENCITNYAMNGIHIEDRSADVTLTDNVFRAVSTTDTNYASHLCIISGSHDITATGNVFDTRLQTNSIDCVYMGAGGPTSTEPYNITVTGNTAYLANGSRFAYIEGDTTNIVSSPNTIL